jgi:RNA polymerase sigma-70 factor (sigma-E family)
MVDVEEDVASFVAARRWDLVRFGFMLSGDRTAAEDLVQEALVRCLPSWRRLDPPGVEAYVRKVMARLAWKARRQPASVPLSGEDADPGKVDFAESSAELADLHRALAALPPQQRIVLVLRYWQGLDEAETAELLGCPVGTVKSRASRAYAKVRRDLDWTDDVAAADDPSAKGGDAR